MNVFCIFYKWSGDEKGGPFNTLTPPISPKRGGGEGWSPFSSRLRAKGETVPVLARGWTRIHHPRGYPQNRETGPGKAESAPGRLPLWWMLLGCEHGPREGSPGGGPFFRSGQRGRGRLQFWVDGWGWDGGPERDTVQFRMRFDDVMPLRLQKGGSASKHLVAQQQGSKQSLYHVMGNCGAWLYTEIWFQIFGGGGDWWGGGVGEALGGTHLPQNVKVRVHRVVECGRRSPLKNTLYP